MITRREYLKLSAAAGVALAISPKRLLADDSPRALVTRAIPGTSEQLPVVGLGSSASFARVAGEGDAARICDILQTLVREGGRVFDTAPGYGASEEVAGRVAQEAGSPTGCSGRPSSTSPAAVAARPIPRPRAPSQAVPSRRRVRRASS